MDRDARAAERSVVDAHTAAVSERLLLDQREAESGALAAGMGPACEPLEDMLPLVDRDAGPVVVDGEASGRLVHLQRDVDVPLAPSVERGVVEQVVDEEPQPLRPAVKDDLVGRSQSDGRCRMPIAGAVDGCVDHLGEVNALFGNGLALWRSARG